MGGDKSLLNVYEAPVYAYLPLLCHNTDLIPKNRTSNKLQWCQFCHFVFETLLSIVCCAGFITPSCCSFFMGKHKCFLFSTTLLGAMLSNVCAKVLLIPLSLSLRHDGSLICVKCGRRKKKNREKKNPVEKKGGIWMRMWDRSIKLKPDDFI